MIKKLLGNWLIQLFCVVWAFYLFLDYINYSGYLVDAFKYFEYADLVVTMIIIVAAISYFLSGRSKTGVVLEIKNFRGIYHYIFVLLSMVLIVIFYLVKTGITESTAAGAFVFFFKTLILH